MLLQETLQNKLIPNLRVDDVKDMYAKVSIEAFHERRRGRGKKLYSEYNKYNKNDTIVISKEDNNDREMAKKLRSDLRSPMAFAGLIRVKPEDLTMEGANERKAREEEHRMRMDKVSIEENSI